MSKLVNYLEFYEESFGGGYGSEPSCYSIEGDSINEVSDVEDVIWQAVEIEGFDNRRILVKSRIEDDGEIVCEDKFYVDAEIKRTDNPSKFIKWGEKKPHIFEIDKKNSKLTVKEYMSTKPNWMKRCPFCNGEVYVAHTSHTDLKHRKHHYVCKKCDAQVFLMAEGKYTSQEVTEAEAMNIWNDSPFLLPGNVI